MFVTWEHAGRILLAKVDLNRWQVDAPVTVSKSGKFPLVLLDADVLLIAWKDGTRLRWQSFQPHSLERREKGSAATNSPHRPAGVAVPGGTFLLLP